jgi:sugar phosphate isomerase/epimerase
VNQPAQGERTGFAPLIAGSTLPLAPRSATQPAPELWAEDVAVLARGGFRAVDLVDTWLSPAALDAGSRKDLASVIREANVSLVGISVIRRSVIDPQDGAANLAHTHASIDAAAELGAPVLSIGFHRPLTPEQRAWAFWAVPGPGDDSAMWSTAVTRLRELASHATQVNVALSLELYEYTLLGSGASAARLVEEVGSLALGINADLANVYRIPERLSETWEQTFALCLPHLNYWHVKNYRRAEHYPDGPFLAWPTALEDGDINYRLALRSARDAGYLGPISIEHYGGDGIWAQERGLRYLESLLADL